MDDFWFDSFLTGFDVLEFWGDLYYLGFCFWFPGGRPYCCPI